MGKRDIRFRIIVESLVKGGVNKALGAFDKLKAKSKSLNFALRGTFSKIPGLSKFTSGLKRAGGGIKSLLTSFGAMAGATAAFSAGIGLAGKAIQTAFRMESVTVQFKTLLGTMEKAEARVKELIKFSDVTPFKSDEVVEASRVLQVFTGDVLATTQGLELVGDAAAASGQAINDVAFWTGRAYAAIKGGQPFGEAAARLMEMGILSATARTKMEALKKSGASGAEIFSVLKDELANNKGAMAELAQTGEGLASTLQSKVSTALLQFGNALLGTSKKGMQGLIDKVDELTSSGKIEQWGQSTIEVLSAVGSAFSKLSESVRYTQALISGMTLKILQNTGQLTEQEFKDALADQVKPFKVVQEIETPDSVKVKQTIEQKIEADMSQVTEASASQAEAAKALTKTADTKFQQWSEAIESQFQKWTKTGDLRKEVADKRAEFNFDQASLEKKIEMVSDKMRGLNERKKRAATEDERLQIESQRFDVGSQLRELHLEQIEKRRIAEEKITADRIASEQDMNRKRTSKLDAAMGKIKEQLKPIKAIRLGDIFERIYAKNDQPKTSFKNSRISSQLDKLNRSQRKGFNSPRLVQKFGELSAVSRGGSQARRIASKFNEQNQPDQKASQDLLRRQLKVLEDIKRKPTGMT